MKLSVVMHTCRLTHPQGLPKPTLDLFVESMMNQDYGGDFELIIVDLAWFSRRDYMQRFDPLVPILHIPDRSTPFRDHDYMRICGPKNTGLIYARGDFVIFTDDCQEAPPNALSLLAEWAEQGHGATMDYEKHRSGVETGRDQRGEHQGILLGDARLIPVSHVGYIGGTMSMVPTSTLEAVNGWDEMFDGSRQLEDADMCIRLSKTGLQMAIERRATLIEHETDGAEDDGYDRSVVKNTYLKCDVGYAYAVWGTERVRANTGEHTDIAVNQLQWTQCAKLRTGNKCDPVMSKCTELGDVEYEPIYRDPRLVFNIAELRQQASWETAHEELIKEMK